MNTCAVEPLQRNLDWEEVCGDAFDDLSATEKVRTSRMNLPGPSLYPSEGCIQAEEHHSVYRSCTIMLSNEGLE